MSNILVTGGAGYIGSHTVYQLLQRGYTVTVLDDLSTGFRDAAPEGHLHICSLFDTEQVRQVLVRQKIEAVVHFASFIAVGESTKEPEKYFTNNVSGSISLFTAMGQAGVDKLVFSSTAAVYGNPVSTPIPETAAIQPVNAYGETKVMVERVLAWLDQLKGLRSVKLRYFNACGANPAAGLSERHVPETHLIPLMLKAVVTGQPMTIFGTDYPTPDGTCIRDYIHVDDLAKAHIVAIDHLLAGGASEAFNVGTGSGFSVREMLVAVEKVTGKPVPHVFGERREGDPAELVADSTKLRTQLGWSPEFTELEQIVASAWPSEQLRWA
jgi:UDP-glucose 4-epimerase